jgi:hypothetical protein
MNERHPNMNTKTNELTQHWVEVTDAQGATHLEAHWIDASFLPANAVSAA